MRENGDEMASCTNCREPRLESEFPRQPCPACGSTALHFSRHATASVGVTDIAYVELAPVDQSFGWKTRWDHIERELPIVTGPQPGGVSGEAIESAAARLLDFFVSVYHLADAIIKDAALPAQQVHQAVNADPALALLADLANTHKHVVLDRKPRSGNAPQFVSRTGETSSDRAGWRVRVTIRHQGRGHDGATLARDAVNAWRQLLKAWGLIP